MNTQMPVAKATLALESDSREAPAGELLTGDGRRRAFCGWMELASAIEDWRQTTTQEKGASR